MLFLPAETEVGQFHTAEGREDGVGGGLGVAVDFGNKTLVFLHKNVALDFECGGEQAVGRGPLVGHEAEALDLLVGGEIAVDFVDNLLVLLLGFGHSQQFLVVAVVHVVFECPVVEGERRKGTYWFFGLLSGKCG